MYVLGLDSSTQSCTAVVLDGDGRTVLVHALNFDRDLPNYGTRGGCLPHPDPAVVHAPPLMWVEALDRLLGELASRIDLGQVQAIAGSAQQHGSVYLDASFPAVLAALDPARPLAGQIAPCLSRASAPIWMDSSTGEDCRALEAALGGPAEVQRITGSAAFERFTGPQIRRFARSEPAAWARTAHVRLVSSFLCSLLAGRLAPTDHGDGSGMNLLDLDRRAWHQPALEAASKRLAERLGEPCAPWTLVGPVAPAIAARFGLPASCQVVAWSGDNPCSAVGLGLAADGDCAVSLGTSDVLMALSDRRPAVPPGGHVFLAPTGAHLALFCFANGSLAREAVRDAHRLDWDGFNAALAARQPGNRGALTLPWFRPEIVPRVATAGAIRLGHDGSDAAADCRAVVEGQFTSLRLRAHQAGIRPAALRATGGAAQNPALLQLLADVFQCPVRRSTVVNTAALGAAVRALHAIAPVGGAARWRALAAAAVDPLLGPVVEPRRELAAVYDGLAERYRAAERAALG